MQRGPFIKQPLAVGQHMVTETYNLWSSLFYDILYAKMYRKRQRPGLRPSPRQGSSRTSWFLLILQSAEYYYSNVGKGIYIHMAPNASFFILKCSKITSVWSSIRFRPRWESLNYSAPYQLFQSWIENGRTNRVYIWCIPYSWNPSWHLGNGSEWGFIWTITYMFLKKAILPRLNKHYLEMYQNRWPVYTILASSEIQLVVLQRSHAKAPEIWS